MGGYPGINPRLRVAHIAATALVLGCASSKSAESSFSQEKEVQTDRNIVKTVERGPERVVEFHFSPEAPDAQPGLPVPTVRGDRSDGGGSPPAGGDPDRPAARHSQATGGASAEEALLGRLTSITITEQAPITTTTKAETATHQEASVKAQGDSQSASKPSLGFLVWPWLLGLAGAVLVGLVVWRLKPNWIGWVVKLFKLGA